MRLSLQATLAQTYFALRAAEAQAALLENTVQAYRRSLEMTQDRYRVGVVSAADVAQAQTQLRSTQAQLVDARRSRAQLEHALAVLVGVPPSAFVLEATAQLPSAPQVPVQLPAQLLERRPDLAAAERLGALLAQHPANGVRDIGLAATIRPNHSRYARFEAERRAIGK